MCVCVLMRVCVCEKEFECDGLFDDWVMNKLVYCNMKLVGHNIFLSSVYMDELWPKDVKQAISVLRESQKLSDVWQYHISNVVFSFHCFFSSAVSSQI